MTLDTPDTSVILGVIAILRAGRNAPKVGQAAVAASVYSNDFHPDYRHPRGAAQLRAVDRALQKARKAGLITSDTRRGWSLTAAGLPSNRASDRRAVGRFGLRRASGPMGASRCDRATNRAGAVVRLAASAQSFG